MRFKTGDVIADRPSWWLYGADNCLVAWAGDMFASLEEAEHAAEDFRYGASRARFELFRDRTSAWRWRAMIGERKIASSSETYLNELAARRAAKNVRDNVVHATPVCGRPALRRTAD